MSYLTESTEKLKELIRKYPDYDICVLAGEDANCGGDYYWMYCSSIHYEVGEIFDHDIADVVFTDRDELEEYIEDLLYDEWHTKSDEEYERAIHEKMNELDPYWKKVICIFVNN